MLPEDPLLYFVVIPTALPLCQLLPCTTELFHCVLQTSKATRPGLHCLSASASTFTSLDEQGAHSCRMLSSSGQQIDG